MDKIYFVLFSFLALHVCQVSGYDNDAEKYFKVYFKKAYKLVLTTNSTSNTSPTGFQMHTTLARSRRDIPDVNKLVQDAWKRYEQRAKVGDIQTVTKEGTTDDKIDFIAKEIWERTGGKWVDKIMETAGVAVGSRVGAAIGGFIGMAVGVAVPPLQLPLVIGGVFIGQNLGRFLGFAAGKISANVINDLIASKLIKPIIEPEMRKILKQEIEDSSKEKGVVCRSDMCSKGNFQKQCQCYQCDAVMDYNDQDGSSSCKKCSVGTVPRGGNGYSRGNTHCTKCRKGNFGKDTGKCYLCDGAMEYGDEEAATSCKKCSLGSMTGGRYGGRNGNTYCAKCRKGNFGKDTGKCYLCHGNMEYSDEEGSTSCKKCSLGSVPGGRYGGRNGNTYCTKCGKGNFGRDHGKCYLCIKGLEYSDAEGATACKKCALGSIPRGRYGAARGNYYCSKCDKGNFGKADGQCYRCSRDNEYSDMEGATACKTCAPGRKAAGGGSMRGNYYCKE